MLLAQSACSQADNSQPKSSREPQYLEEILSKLQLVTHLREKVYAAVIEQQVDKDHALVRCLQEVTKYLGVCEHVHHDR